jgi:hypothetical protein
MVTTRPWLLISMTTMRRLGGSVDADIVVIDGVTTGDRVVMGDGKLGEVVGGCCCCCCWGLVGIVVGCYGLQDSLLSARTFGSTAHM